MTSHRGTVKGGVLATGFVALLALVGCEAVVAALFLLLIELGREVIKSGVITHFIERKLDEVFMDRNDNRAKGGEFVVDSSDQLRGHYSGKLRITVRDDDGKNSTQDYDNPKLIRSSPTGKWQLPPDLRHKAAKRAGEKWGDDGDNE